jgi:hypothetical protein
MSDEHKQTRYDVVRQQFAEREDAQRKYIQENNHFAAMVANGFRDFMGMPEQYEHTKNGSTTYRNYVPLYRLEDDGSFIDETFWSDAICHYSDGNFNFGLGVVLERSPNAYPKRVLQAKIECTRKSGTVEVKVAGETVTCTFDGTESADISEVHYLLFRLSKEWLASRWGDPTSGRSIGFHLG